MSWQTVEFSNSVRQLQAGKFGDDSNGMVHPT